MTFTNTTYNVVSDEVQVFKTLDKKYLPEINYEDLNNKPNFITREEMEAYVNEVILGGQW